MKKIYPSKFFTVQNTKTCKFCKAEIFWVQSSKGKWYPCNVYTVRNNPNEKFSSKSHWHTCQRELSNDEQVEWDRKMKEMFCESERREEENVYRREMEKEMAREEAQKEKERKEFEAKAKDALARLHWDKREQIKFEHDAALIRSALTHKWDVGGNAVRLGKFGGYSSVGNVMDNGDGTVTIQSVYHIGD